MLRRLAAVCAILVLGAIVSLATGAAKSRPTNEEVVRAMSDFERLAGADAEGFVRQKLLTDSDFAAMQERSRENLTRRGFKPKNEYQVFRVKGSVSKTKTSLLRRWLGTLVPSLEAQTFYGAGGWVALSAWGGPADSWVGNIYANDGHGMWESIDAAHDNTTADRPVYWADRLGGNSDRVRGRGGVARLLGAFDAAVCALGCDCNPQTMGRCMLRGALGTSRYACSVAVGRCAFSDGTYWACAGVASEVCVTAFAVGFIMEMHDIASRCW
jgi:hypothetical protein